MNDAELEQHIADLARLIEKAYADGDRAAAQAWAAAMAEAKKGLSPQWIEARETKLGLAPCQFTVMGEEARRDLVGSN